MFSRRRLLQAGAAITSQVGRRGEAAAGSIQLALQTRDRDNRPRLTTESVDPRKVAVIAVDCWHYHFCRTWRNRAGSLIPRFNYSFDCRAQAGNDFHFQPDERHARSERIAAAEEYSGVGRRSVAASRGLPDPYPGNLRYGMCECGLGDDCHYTNNTNNQHPDLKMTGDDYIALTQQETYNVLKHRGITHIIYTGFATNMCLWNKPTGMKFMRQFGFQCAVARDLTEAITRYAEESFNPTQGTLEVLELIERDLAPTLNMEETMRRAGAWTGNPVLDYVHIAPWGRFFGAPAYTIPVQAELRCRHVPGAELRYTLDGSEPTAASALYRKPIKIDKTLTLKAAGFKGADRVTRVSVADYFKFPPTPPPPEVFISDLDPVSQWTGEPRAGVYAVRKEPRLNRSVDGNILSNRDYKVAKGIGVQAPARMVFALKPEYRRFVALTGVDDECMRWDSPDGLKQWPQWSRQIQGPTSYRISQVIFTVRIDGNTVARTPALFNGDKSWGIDLPIPSGARQIELAVEDVDSKITDPQGHGDWLNAGFLTT